MAATEPVSGVVDLAEEQAARAEALAETSRAFLREHGYGPVKPPILERAAPFLDRLGEEIRSKMYIFTDPGGHEVCLRPEMTIPTARLYADRVQARRPEFRCYYVGSVFRFDAPAIGRYRQSTQAGAEFFGGPDAAAADAEVLAVAVGLLGAYGLAGLEVQVGDVAFFTALLADLRLADTWRVRLLQSRSDAAALERELAVSDALADADADADADAAPSDDGIGALLDRTPASQRDALLGRILAAVGPEHFGVRTPEDIARRLRNRAASRGPIDPSIADALRALLAIDAPLADGLAQVRRIAEEARSDALGEAAAAWGARVEAFRGAGIDPGAVRLRPRLGHGVHYYTGFVFEVHDGSGAGESQLCGGGRYDDLVAAVGGAQPAPAVGFSLGLERIQVGLDAAGGPEGVAR